MYLADFALSDRSPSPILEYQDRTEQQVRPALGEVRVRELNVGRPGKHRRAQSPIRLLLTYQLVSYLCHETLTGGVRVPANHGLTRSCSE